MTKQICVLVLAAAAGFQAWAVTPPAPYGPTPAADQIQWHETEFYSIIHLSLNTYTGQQWGYGNESVALFNPSNFSANAIASVCQAAGMKGINVVAKHHCGFCIWPSAYTDSLNTWYSVPNVNCPWKGGKGDMLREYQNACQTYGLKLGVYLSPWDRHSADYGLTNSLYPDYYHNQLRELTANYGPLFIIWFDGANGGSGWYGGCNCTRTIDASTYYGWPTIYGIVATNQPLAATFGGDIRWVGNESGVANSPCWPTMGPGGSGNATSGVRVIGNNGVWRPAEADTPLRGNDWFYVSSDDNNVKSAATLYSTYFQTVGNGAALDLGLAPMPDGTLFTNDVTALLGLGRMLHRTFDTNLALTAHIVSGDSRDNDPAFAPANMLNTNYSTLNWHWNTNAPSYWSTDDAETNAAVVFGFDHLISFSVVALREYIPLGARVDLWELDAMINGQWQPVTTNADIGAQRYVRFAPVVSDQVRLRVQGPVCPAISYFGLYSESGNDVWTGAGTNANWSTAANWGGTVPQTGDSLLFLGGANRTNVNDLSGLSVNTVQFGDGGFSLTGNPLAVSGGITNATGTNMIGLNLALSGGGISSAGALALAGNLSGSSGMTLSGMGSFVFSGTNSITGNVTVDQATVTVAPGRTLGWAGAGWPVQTLTLQNGGTLQAYDFGQGASSMWGRVGDGTATLTLNNGTFRLLASDSNAINRGVTVGTGGGTLEAASGVNWIWGTTARGVTLNGPLTFTGAGNATVNRPITGSGSLTKSGAGSWALGWNDTYTGATFINGGTLALSAAGNLPSTSGITIAPGGMFDVSARPGFAIGSGVTLTAGRAAGFATDVNGNLTNSGTLNIGGTGAPATLTINGSLSLAGGTINFDLTTNNAAGAGVNDFITNIGALFLSGTTTIQINLLNGGLNPGTYTLIGGSSLAAGGGANLTLGAGLPSGGRQTCALDTTTRPGNVLLQVSGSPSAALTWSGANGNVWNFTSTNWWNGAAADLFYNLDRVVFDDSSAVGNITLVGSVAPGTVTVSNAATSYVITGGGGITGATGLLKTGAGALTLATANTYSGLTIINGGTLQLGANGTTGSVAGTITNNGNLTIARADSFTFANPVSGPGTFTQAGSGTLTLAAPQAYTGDTRVNSGILALNTAGAAFPGNAVINNGGTLQLGQANALNQTVLVTVNGGGAFDLNGLNCALGGLAGAGAVAGVSRLYFDGTAATPNFSGTIPGGSLFVRGANNLGGAQVFAGAVTNSLLVVGYQPGNLSGRLNIAGGTVACAGYGYVGGNSGLGAAENVFGALTVSGGTLILAGTEFDLGQSVNGSATVAQFTQTGGTVLDYAGWTGIANGGGVSQLDLSGGTFTMSPSVTYPGLHFGVRGSATLNLGGTALMTCPGITFFQNDAVTGGGHSATINLNGGTLVTGPVSAGTTLSTSTFNFNGGTLQPVAASAAFFQGLSAAYVKDGGAVIDTAGFAVTVNQALQNGGAGGLTKQGAGTLTLNSDNSYIGVTTIAAGTLALGGSGSFVASSAVVVQSNAVLDVSGQGSGFAIPAAQTFSGNGSVRGAVTVNGILTPGSVAAIGGLNFNAGLTLAGGTVMKVSRNVAASNDTVVVSGTLTEGGTLTVTNLGAAPAAGDQFKLFNAVTFSGAFSGWNLPPLPAGLFWNTHTLAVDGILRVAAVPKLQSSSVTGGTNLNFQVQTEPGVSYILEKTESLAAPVIWMAISTNVGTGNPLNYRLPLSLQFSQTFFRIFLD